MDSAGSGRETPRVDVHASPLSAREAADALGVNERTVRRAIARGDLPAIKQAGSFQITQRALVAFRARLAGLSEFNDPPPRQIHLPAALTSFVGRKREIAEIMTLLDGDEGRLLTLTGPGGVGKTRLALHVADEYGQRFTGDIRFVSLAEVAGPGAVALAIAQAVGMQHSGGDPLPDALARYLGDRPLLLVLDNFEHLTPAASVVADLLVRCPRMRMLVTSRVRLRLDGEREYPVPPLDYPDPVALSSPTPADVADCSAVALFVARARAVDRSFTLTQRNAGAVAEICACLDGLPLAIELAAARSKMLSPRILLGHLSRPLELLVGRSVDRPARQQTLRDAIAWSYELLTPEDQALFRRVSVCVGGFEPGLATAIAAPKGDSAAHILHIHDGMQRLVDHNLVRSSGDGGPRPRFAMLATIREYGLEQLEASGEEEEVRRAHAAWVLDFAERHEVVPYDPVDDQRLARHKSEQGNVDIALTWLETNEPARFVRLVGSLGRYWWVRGHRGRERAWLERAAALGELAPVESRAKVVAALGFLLLVANDLAQAHDLFTEGLVLFRSIEDEPGTAHMLMGLGVVASYREEYDQAAVRFGESLARARALPDPRLAAVMAAAVLRNLGVAARAQRRFQQASAYHTEALQLERQAGYIFGAMHSLADLGNVARDLGDLARAGACYRESLDLGRLYGENRVTLWALEGIASIAAADGDTDAAARLFGAVHRWRETTGITQQPPSDEAASERALELVRAVMGKEAFSAAWSDGEALSIEQAVMEAESLPSIGSSPVQDCFLAEDAATGDSSATSQ